MGGVAVVVGFTGVEDDGDAVLAECDGPGPHALRVVPVVWGEGDVEVEPVDQIGGDGVTPHDVAPERAVRVVLVEEVVVAFVKHRPCITTAPQNP